MCGCGGAVGRSRFVGHPLAGSSWTGCSERPLEPGTLFRGEWCRVVVTSRLRTLDFFLSYGCRPVSASHWQSGTCHVALRACALRPPRRLLPCGAYALARTVLTPGDATWRKRAPCPVHAHWLLVLTTFNPG